MHLAAEFAAYIPQNRRLRSEARRFIISKRPLKSQKSTHEMCMSLQQVRRFFVIDRFNRLSERPHKSSAGKRNRLMTGRTSA